MSKTLLILAALAVASPATGQLGSGLSPSRDGVIVSQPVRYAWLTGDTLIHGLTYLNVTSEDQPSALQCEFSLTGTIELDAFPLECMIPDGPVAPGDSTWLEYRAVVRSPPGTYSYSVDTSRSGSGGSFRVWADSIPLMTMMDDALNADPLHLLTVNLAGDTTQLPPREDLSAVARDALDEAGFRLAEGAPEGVRALSDSYPVITVSFRFEEELYLAWELCFGGALNVELPFECRDSRVPAAGDWPSDFVIGARLAGDLQQFGRTFKMLLDREGAR